MGFREWPYWLKGGVISIVLFAILTIVLIPFGETSGHLSVPYWALPSIYLSFLLIILGFTLDNFFSQAAIMLSFSAIIYFIIGAGIGWTIGKIINIFDYIKKTSPEIKRTIKKGTLIGALIISPLTIIMLLIIKGANLGFGGNRRNIFVFLIVSSIIIILLSIIGAGIGWIYGKIKNKNTSNQQ